MINKRFVYILVSIVFVSAATIIYAGTTVKDEIEMKNPAYTEHNKGIVVFSHKKHVEDYKAGCGECHHDESKKPLDGLKAGDNVANCIECHKIPAEPPKGKDAPKLTDVQKREYHAQAVHDNCRGCHKAFNKEKGLKSKDPGYAPTSCKQCHPKK